MRWRIRDEPWGSHHVEARALKWEISSALTEEKDADELSPSLGSLLRERDEELKLRRMLGLARSCGRGRGRMPRWDRYASRHWRHRVAAARGDGLIMSR